MRQTFQLKTALLALLFLTFACTSVSAQEAAITGKITDTEGESLIEVTVRIIGSVIGASTDLKGHYEI